MDIGEYRLERSKDGLYDIKVSKWNCYCPIFTIKGQKANQYDFGEGDDIDFADKPKYGCGNKVFVAKPATQKVLDKYGITIDEYNEIADVLVEGLSFGYCGLCS